MKRRLALLAGFLIAAACVPPLLISCALEGPPSPDEPGLQYNMVAWNGISRAYAMYAPASTADPAPLVLLLHGGFGSAASFWETEFVQSWKALADADGLFLVLPEGAPDEGAPSGHHWNDCRVDAGNADSLSIEDDVGFISSVIDAVSARDAVDATRIYVAGISNGGMMAYRLAMQLGDRLAAAAAIVANLPDPSECAFSAEPLPILIMDGTADPVMPYDGGCVLGPACQRGGVRSTAATVAFWVMANGASATPSVTDLPDTVASDESTVRVFRFDGGTSGDEVVLYRVDGGGHSAPGPLPAENKNRDIDAAAEIWGFFAAHVRAML
jgi:polyhydroxybutyrate depolymerase